MTPNFSFSLRTHYRLVLLVLCLAILGVTRLSHANPRVLQPNGTVSFSVEDMQVKTANGMVPIQRAWGVENVTLGGGTWYLNPQWAALRFKLDSLNRNIVSIGRLDAEYGRGGNDIFVFDRQYFIKLVYIQDPAFPADPSKRILTGYRYYSSKGDWTTYNTAGQPTAYGDRNGTFASFELDTTGRNIQAIRDGQGRVIYTFTYTGGVLSRITDFSGRQVNYIWTGGGLSQVTDVLGNSTRYEYVDAKIGDLTNDVIATDINSFQKAGSIPAAFTIATMGVSVGSDIGYTPLVGTPPKERAENHLRGGNLIDTPSAAAHVRAPSADSVGNLRILPKAGGAGTTANPSIDAGVTNLIDRKSADALGPGRTKNLSAIIDPEGRRTSFLYSGPTGNRVVAMIDPEGAVTSYKTDYDKQKRQWTTVTTGPTTSSVNTYNALGQIVTGFTGTRNVSSMIKESDNVEINIDERGFRTRTEYDGRRNPIKVTYPDGASTTSTFDPVFANPLTRTDEAGVQTRYEYDTNGNLTRMVEAVGQADERVTSYTYNAVGKRLTMTREGKAAVPANAATNTPAIPATAAATTTYTYDSVGNLTSMTDAEGNKTEYLDYDAIGNAGRIKDARGNITLMAYNARGWLTSQTNPLGHTTTFGYDKTGNRTSVTDAKGNVTRYRYDLANRLVEITDPQGGLTTYEYDGSGRKLKDTDAGTNVAGNTLTRSTSTYTYDTDGRLTTLTDGNGNVTTHVYGNSDNSDGLAGLLKRIDYPTYSEEYRYDNRNRLTQTIQILAASNGGAANTSNAVRYTTTKEYDARGNVISQVDPLGRKTQMEYDALNRLVKTTDPMTPTAGITRQLYDVRDNLLAVIDALSSTTRYEYDRANRMTREIRPLGEATSYTYDSGSNLTRRVSAQNETRQYTFDAANRRTREQHFAASVTPNAPPEATTAATNAARSISYTYDERGLLVGYTDSGDTNFATTSTSNPSPIPATGNSAVYEYDSKGLKTRETVTVQTSGSGGVGVSVTLTASNSTTKTTATSYHPNGLKASMTYPNVVGSHSTAAVSSNTSGNSAGFVSYVYDTNNQLKQINLPSSTAQSPKAITISAYQWTAPSQKLLPGAVVNMTYDALLRPTRMTSQAIGNNGTTQAPTGYIIHDTRLTYNDVSNIIKRETEHGTYTYGYDDLDRLTQVVPPASINFPSSATSSNLNLPIEGYTYDAVHNRKSSLHQTGSIANAWTYNAHHQLTQYGDPTATSSSSLASILHPKVTQTYNANGHLTTKTVTPEDTSPAGLQAGKQSQRYTYSVSERLLRISDGSSANNGQGAEIARYAYDPFGRRIKKTVSQTPSGQGSTGTTLYFYADEGLIAEVDGSPTTNGGNITTTYGWMPNNTWGTAPQWKRDHAGQSGATDVQGSANTNGITHYVHVDHLGTSQRLTNTQGETTWRAVSEAFGKTFVDTTLAPATTGATTNNLRFPGQYEDVETGTYYNFMRTYLPMVGRYGETDPIGLYAGLNTYTYVEGNPVSLTDPLGLWAWGDPVDQDIADAVTGFGDSIISTLTFGGLSGQGLRDGLDIGGGVNKCSRFYMGGRVAGTTATLLANATGAIPKALTHFTTQAGARGIAQSGIRASRGGLFGGGRYTSSVGPFPRNPFVPPRSTVGVAINNTAGYVRAVPGTFLNPTAAGAAQLGAMNAAYGAAANRDMFDQKCGCENQ